MNTSIAISSYQKVGIESAVAAADPHKLISMLYQGALQAINNAKTCIARKDIAGRGKAISHAIAIIDSGLNESLDKNVGGELAQNLSALYEYMSSRLITANVKNDTAALDEVAGLLQELKTAWDSIRPSTPAAAADAPPQKIYAQG